MDRLDRRILELLQQEGRLSYAELARRVHLSPTPCMERVRRLERLGYIRGYAAHLDPQRLGARLLALVEIRLDRTTPEVFERLQSLRRQVYDSADYDEGRRAFLEKRKPEFR